MRFRASKLNTGEISKIFRSTEKMSAAKMWLAGRVFNMPDLKYCVYHFRELDNVQMYWPYNVNIDFFSEMKCSTLCHSISRENVIIG